MIRILKRLHFWINARRLGADMPMTYPLLYSRRLATWLCRRKFLFFGTGAEFRPGAYAVETNRIHIGDHVVIRPGAMLFASSLSDIKCHIYLADKCLIGSNVHIYVSNHNFSNPLLPIYDQGHSSVKPVEIHTGAWIGANATILPGVIVGKNAVVGAGSIVTRDVEPFSVVAGNPARLVRKLV